MSINVISDMFELGSATPALQKQFKQALVEFKEKHGNRARTVMIHTHPNYGQVHIYLTEKRNADPYEDLVGHLPIKFVYNADDLEVASTDGSGFVMPDGQESVPRNNSEFNSIFAQYCAMALGQFLPSIDLTLCPETMIVEAEAGEITIKWWPRPQVR